MQPRRVVVAAMWVALWPVSTAVAAEGTLTFSGSAKSVLLDSRTVLGEAFDLSLNRLRLALQGGPTAGLAVDLQVDQEILLGSYLRTAAFRAAKDRPSPQYWRAEMEDIDRGDAYGRLRLYRGSLTWTRGNVDVKLGRQRVAWGTGRFWSPLDILNPVDPLALEREERPGVDAALVEIKTGALSRLSIVYAPAPDRGPASRAVLWHGNQGGVDVSLVGGRLLGADVVGTDAAGQLGQAGVRAEAACLRPRDASAFWRATGAIDYAFDNGLTLSAELHYNGSGSRDPARYLPRTESLSQLSPATRYAGLYASYEVTPLLKWNTYAVRNLDDRSRGVDTRLVWSWRANVDLTAGFQRFAGRSGSEYGGMPRAVLAQWQMYF